MLQGISLEWWRDALGYRIEESLPPMYSPTNPMLSLPERWLAEQPSLIKPQRIVRAGGRQISYRPAEMIDQIFTAFINTEPTPEGLLDFINRFGPLTQLGLDESLGEPVNLVINLLKWTIAVIKDFGETDKAIQRRALARTLGADGLEFSGIKVRVLFDEQTQTLRTEHVVENLVTALCLRMLQVQASDIVMRKCGHCGAWFTAGLGTGRHLNARFCTDEHRIVFNSLKRTPKAAA